MSYKHTASQLRVGNVYADDEFAHQSWEVMNVLEQGTHIAIQVRKYPQGGIAEDFLLEKFEKIYILSSHEL